MAKLHIVGIGGTGHKVLQSAIHLAACGAFKGKVGTHEISEVRVMTIDADDSNGNLNLTQKTLEAYQAFKSAISGGEFGLADIATGKTLNMRLYDGEKDSINKTFNIAKFSGRGEDALLRFLYTDAEIDAEFNQGFYGHTSIGTLIVENMFNDEKSGWKDFESSITDGDFVVVTGSIFGGTGASAIPVALQNLSALKEKKSFNLAAIMLTPYFNAVGDIQEAGQLQPDSSKFQVKAKAGLYYYRLQNRYKLTDALYIIGEPESNYSNEAASRGSLKQLNKAHPMELFAATGIFDFIVESKDRTGKNGIITADRDKTKEGDYCYTWGMLQKAGQNFPSAMQNFLRIAIFYNKMLYNDIKNQNGPGVWQSLYEKKSSDEKSPDKGKLCDLRDASNNLLFENIYGYLRLFVDWMYDLHKKNLIDIDKNPEAWEPDTRVRFFNTGGHDDGDLFNNKPVTNYALPGFDDLVYNERDARKPEWIYAMLCEKLPARNKSQKGGPFAALFDSLFELIKAPQKKGAFDKTSGPEKIDYDSVFYFSQENNVTPQRGNAGANKLWTSADSKLLFDIADGLPNTTGKNFTRNDMSIPSPWSIFIMNELALTEEKFKQINKNAFNQWCGILALVALRKLNGYDDLQLESLNYADETDAFITTARNTCTPQSFIFGDLKNQDWTKCVRVSLNGKTLAFLANNTLVCPAYTLEDTKIVLNKMAPTIVNAEGEFLPPENYFSSTSSPKNLKAKHGLRLFLEDLQKALTEAVNDSNGKLIEKLQKHTDTFLAALGGDKITPIPSINITAYKKITSVETLFDRLCPEDHGPKEESPFMLDGMLAEAKEKVVLIGDNICEISWTSPDAAEIHITDQLLYNKVDAANIPGLHGQVKNNIRLVWDDKLLADSMVMITRGDAPVFEQVLSNPSLPAEYEIIWPVYADLAKWFSMEALNRMLSVSMTRDTVTVTLTLKVKGSYGNGRHIVQKKYRVVVDETMAPGARDGVCIIFEKNRLPFWAVWPYAQVLNNQKANSWKRYNFFCIDREYRNTPVFGMEPFFEGGEDQTGAKQNLDSVSEPGVSDVSYRRYEKLPAGFMVHEKTDADQVYWGMVLLAPPEVVPYGGDEWNIGVDFGTTSTTAFYSTNGSVPQSIRLLTEYEWIPGKEKPITQNAVEIDRKILCNSDTASVNEMEKYFIDKQCFNQNGWITAWEVMDTVSDDTHETIFRDGRIFWHNHENFKDLNAREPRRKNLKTNIKWETTSQYSGKYLNQLLTQIVYHAAKSGARKINWFFSYPTAFGFHHLAEFSEMLGSLLEGLRQETGIEQVFNGQDSMLPESMAAAYYFRKKDERQGVFLCVDIGGGTSDISLWIKKEYAFQSSIRFASRDMFVEPLKLLLKQDSVMHTVRTPNPADGIHTMLEFGRDDASLSDERIKSFIEVALVEYLPDFKKRLNSLAGQDLAAYKNFRYRVLIAYSGLVYYLAGIIAQLCIEEKIDKDTTKIVLGLSGKGAKMTDWINAYTQLIYGAAQTLIKEKTGGVEIELLEKFEPKAAKTETATGLIANLDGSGKLPDRQGEANSKIFMGASIELTDGKTTKNLSAGESIDPYSDSDKDGFYYHLENLKVNFTGELPEMEGFINFFNNIARQTRGDINPIDENWWERHKKDLRNQFKTVFENTLAEKRFEAPFIVMIRVFLMEYNND